jgi:hypothetical protein
MSFKLEKYSKRDDFDEFESIGDRLAADLRKSIRQLVSSYFVSLCRLSHRYILVTVNFLLLQDNYPILSDPWFEMAETFGRIAHISNVESALPSSKKDGTLWETEEQALRFLLEDGKLNLCLRALIEFKSRQIESRQDGRGPMVSKLLSTTFALFVVFSIC